VLHIEKQPVEAGNGHGLGDLDAARHAHANPERQLALFKLFTGDIADSGGHKRHSLMLSGHNGGNVAAHFRNTVTDCR
jgi:hypothetical protein